MKILILMLSFLSFGVALADPIIKVSLYVETYQDTPKLKQKIMKACRSELEAIDNIELTDCDCNADYMIRIDALANVKGLGRKFYVISMILATPDISRDGIKSAAYPTFVDRSLGVTDSLAEYCHIEIGRFNRDSMQFFSRLELELKKPESSESTDCECGRISNLTQMLSNQRMQFAPAAPDRPAAGR